MRSNLRILLLALVTAAVFGVGCGGAGSNPGLPAKSDAERTLGLGWMPEQTEAVIHLKIAELWKAPLLKGLCESPQAVTVLGDLEKNTGLAPADIESITIGLIDFQAVKASLFGSILGMPMTPPRGTVVIRTTKSMSQAEFLKVSDDIQAAKYNSKSYFKFANADVGGWLADPKTLIIAPTADLESTMDRGETSRTRSELSFMETSAHIMLIVSPKDSKTLTKGMFQSPAAGTPTEIVAMRQTLTESLPAVGLGIRVRGGFEVRAALLLDNAESAGKVKAGMDLTVADGKRQYEGNKRFMLAELADQCDALLTNLQVESRTKVVELSTNLPDSSQQKIEELIPLVLGEMGVRFPGAKADRPGSRPINSSEQGRPVAGEQTSQPPDDTDDKPERTPLGK